MVHWLAVGGTFGHGAFTASAAHTDTVDDVAWNDKMMRIAAGILAAYIWMSTHPAWPCIPVCGPCRVWWVVERDGGWTVGGTASTEHGAKSASHRTASCAITPAYTYMLPCWLNWRGEIHWWSTPCKHCMYTNADKCTAMSLHYPDMKYAYNQRNLSESLWTYMYIYS